MTRPRLTPKNIKTQAETAPAGTIVHHAGKTTTCQRKINKTDEVKDGNITLLGEATHIENVTCLHCRKEYHQARKEWHAQQSIEASLYTWQTRIVS